MDPKYLFEYPDEKNYSYYWKDEATDNNEASGIKADDPYAFVMVDGDTNAYDESLVDQWVFLEDGGLNAKRDGATRQKRDIFTFREDTFDNVVETYVIRCANLNADRHRLYHNLLRWRIKYYCQNACRSRLRTLRTCDQLSATIFIEEMEQHAPSGHKPGV